MGNLLDHQQIVICGDQIVMSEDQSMETFSHLTSNLAIHRVERDLIDPAAVKTRWGTTTWTKCSNRENTRGAQTKPDHFKNTMLVPWNSYDKGKTSLFAALSYHCS